MGGGGWRWSLILEGALTGGCRTLIRREVWVRGSPSSLNNGYAQAVPFRGG